MATAALLGVGLHQTARAIFFRAKSALAHGLNRSESALYPKKSSSSSSQPDHPFEPDDESFESGLSFMKRIRQFQRLMSKSTGLGFSSNSPTSASISNPTPSKQAPPSPNLLAQMPRPPFASLIIHVKEPLMHPQAWGFLNRTIGLQAPPNHPSEADSEFDKFSKYINSKTDREELLIELRKITDQFLEAIDPTDKPNIRELIENTLQRIKAMPIAQIKQEVQSAHKRLRMSERGQYLRHCRLIHCEKVLREGYALSAGADGTGHEQPPMPLRIVPRTNREKLATLIMNLLYPYVTVGLQSDIAMVRRVSWLPDALVWVLLHGVVSPLYSAKIGFYVLKRRLIMMVFGFVVLLLPALPIPFAVLLVKFLLTLFGVG
eukprot:CAMPEP_0184490890 /NCGR_PEP_ID=MMETSP0113_2-20130426/19146_1 /TAXON_ID=91329 /ORGANISM="Norrisiella sphaerica, Strain BC52" /LENGTH=375 /DNA_ID=CAMNT_0026875015 /DNA_START=657 /DNA_END=1784 /DNA_ORIENTATION=-